MRLNPVLAAIRGFRKKKPASATQALNVTPAPQEILIRMNSRKTKQSRAGWIGKYGPTAGGKFVSGWPDGASVD